MKPVTVEFVVDEWEEMGSWGWRPKCQPDFDPLTNGFGIAHDAMEHKDLSDSSLEAEVMAFGAMLYVRGENGWFAEQQRGTHYSYQEIMGGDLATPICDSWKDPDRCPLPEIVGFEQPLDDQDDDIRQIARLAVAETLQVVPDRLDERVCLSELVHLRRNLADWLRRGYRDAVQRFGDTPQWMVGELFKNMADAVDGKSRHYCREEYQGTTMTITYPHPDRDANGDAVLVVVKEPWEDELETEEGAEHE